MWQALLFTQISFAKLCLGKVPLKGSWLLLQLITLSCVKKMVVALGYSCNGLLEVSYFISACVSCHYTYEGHKKMLVFKTHVNRHQIRVPFGEDHLFESTLISRMLLVTRVHIKKILRHNRLYLLKRENAKSHAVVHDSQSASNFSSFN